MFISKTSPPKENQAEAEKFMAILKHLCQKAMMCSKVTREYQKDAGGGLKVNLEPFWNPLDKSGMILA